MNLDKGLSSIRADPGVLTLDECGQFIRRIEDVGLQAAPINTFGGKRINLTVNGSCLRTGLLRTLTEPSSTATRSNAGAHLWCPWTRASRTAHNFRG